MNTSVRIIATDTLKQKQYAQAMPAAKYAAAKNSGLKLINFCSPSISFVKIALPASRWQRLTYAAMQKNFYKTVA